MTTELSRQTSWSADGVPCVDALLRVSSILGVSIMWVTFIRELFATDERTVVREALEDLCSPLDSYGWSSQGIYTFWDPCTRAILYIGLARDLPLRFAQHAGLRPCPPANCKCREMETWFEQHSQLGYAIIVQSPNLQPLVTRLARKLQVDPADFIEDDPLPGELQALEGRVIELHRLRFGSLPAWNKVGGSVVGQAQVASIPALESERAFELFTGAEDSLLVARRTIRQLAEDATATSIEIDLHAARLMVALHHGLAARGSPWTDSEILQAVADHPGIWGPAKERILESPYVRQASPFRDAHPPSR